MVTNISNLISHLTLAAFLTCYVGACSSAQDIHPKQQAPQTPSGSQARRSKQEELTAALLKGDRSVLPELAHIFDSSKSVIQKGQIASILLSSGVADQKYFSYLESRGRAAIERSAPSPLVYDEGGNLVKGKLSPKYLAWCKQKGIDPKSSAFDSLYGPPQEVFFLAASGDPRGYDLLVHAVSSDNYLLAAVAAQGLAKIHDPRAIDPMIEACEKAPPEGAHLIASGLAYFDDSRAQASAEKCFGNVLGTYKDFLEKEVRAKGIKGIFGY